MFERIAKVLRRKKDVPERVILKFEGFDLYSGDTLKGGVQWHEIDKIEVFKEDLITYDMVCMEWSFRIFRGVGRRVSLIGEGAADERHGVVPPVVGSRGSVVR